ncbi:MAG: hypothetical protein LBM02_05140 [Lachnospiraceae bacterium]|jgi:hypothetical protein|nr:hypothetical protein [Lachnospiraceae bacterium]
MGNIAVIDTETNWSNELMSIGIVIADEESFAPTSCLYYIVDNISLSGMFSDVLSIQDDYIYNNCICTSRREYTLDECSMVRLMLRSELFSPKIKDRNLIIQDIKSKLISANVHEIFAYNAGFDRGILPELNSFPWYDIMKLAAYKQHNYKIDSFMECCKTGRLKRSYGVEPMYRLLSGKSDYFEVHNALIDAFDELGIMKMLRKEADYFRDYCRI